MVFRPTSSTPSRNAISSSIGTSQCPELVHGSLGNLDYRLGDLHNSLGSFHDRIEASSHPKNSKKLNNPKKPKISKSPLGSARAVHNSEKHATVGRWRLPPFEQSRLETIVSSISKLGYEYVPTLPDPDSLSLQNPMSDDGMGVYELVEEEEDESQDTQQFDDVVKRFDEQSQAAAEKTKEINLGTEEHPKVVQISATLEPSEEQEILEILREYHDVFASDYIDMPGLDPSLVEHRIPLQPDAKPVKQKLRRMLPDVALKVKEEVDKLHQAKFIRVVLFPEWIANIVPVAKKDGRVRVCIDFRNLNKSSPKDDFPLPHIDVLVDNTAGHAMLSFMDGYSGYNQIKLSPEDQEKTSFTTPWGTYCYVVMPFGLKNAGATYQRAMTAIFHDMMHDCMEVYVDDILVKSKTRAGHIEALRRVLQRSRETELRMNPKKCVFGVSAGKLLGFMVSNRGIEVDPAKIKAILEMPPPKNLKQLRGLIGRLQFIRRFISQHSQRCEPFYKLLKGGAIFKWDHECQKAFDDLKHYLLNAPVLKPPVKGQPLILYASATESAIGIVLGQYDESGKKEHAIYYLSKSLLPYEQKYSPIERTCLAVVWATQKLRHYFLAHSIRLLARMDPLKYIFEKPISSGKIARWQMLLSEFDITYVTQKSIKGQAIADHLAHLPLPTYEIVKDEFPDEELLNANIVHVEKDLWTLYFDGSLNETGRGIGIVLQSPEGVIIPKAFKLNFIVTNNTAEYEALVAGLREALFLNIKKLKVFGDSKLVISQVLGEWKVNSLTLAKYHKLSTTLAARFERISFIYIPRALNRLADSLATLASISRMPFNDTTESFVIRKLNSSAIDSFDPELKLAIIPYQPQFFSQNVIGGKSSKIMKIEFLGRIHHDDDPMDDNPWFYDIKNYLLDGYIPEYASKSDRRALKELAQRYTIVGGQLYKRSFQGVLLRCVDAEEASHIIYEAHSGVCGGHVNGQMLAKKILRQGYYWPTLERDSADYVRKCKECQLHADLIHAPASTLHPTTAPWPFSTWAFDVIGPLTQTLENTHNHAFILTATEYYTKWAEAESFVHITANTVIRFIIKNIIARFGVPKVFVTDNGPQFTSQKMYDLCNKFNIELHHSSPYYPQGNGQAEATNKTLIKIIKKTLETPKGTDWPHRLVEALWAYRTSIRTPTGETPFSLTYGMEAVLPYEVQIPSLRVHLDKDMTVDQRREALLMQLELLDEKRLKAAEHAQVYQRRISRAYNKHVLERKFKIGDVVTKKIVQSQLPHIRGKLRPNWEGPYVIKEVYPGNAYKLVNSEGEELPNPWNAMYLRKYVV